MATLCTVCGLLLLLSGRGHAAMVGDLDLLRLVGAGHRANFERLITWKGRMSVEEEATRPAMGRKMHVSSVVSFAYDRKRDAVRWNRKIVRRDSRADGTPLPQHPDSEENRMIIGASLYRMRWEIPLEAKSKKRRSLLVKSSRVFETSSQNRNAGWNFIPTSFFKHQSDYVYEKMAFYCEYANELRDAAVTRTGDLVTVNARLKDHRLSLTYTETYDISQGCNMVAHHQETRWEGYTNIWDLVQTFEEISGVHVPKTSIHKGQSEPESSRRIAERKVVFVTESVNEPLDASEFSPEALGVRPGDRVEDQVGGLRYRHAGSTRGMLDAIAEEGDALAESGAQGASPQRSVLPAVEAEGGQSPWMSVATALLLAMVVLVGAGVVVLALRRRAQRLGPAKTKTGA